MFVFLKTTRSPWVTECEAYWRHSRQFTASFRTPVKAESSWVITAVCKIAAENDRPQTDCNRTCAAVANLKENGDRHEPSPTPTRNLQGLVLRAIEFLIHWQDVRSSKCTISVRETNITFLRNYCEKNI